MTVKEAKETFARFMSESRKRTLTPTERKYLRTASQVIRHARRTTAATPNRKRVGRVSKRTRSGATGQSNPRKAVLIYDHVTRIEATKGSKSLYPKQKFFHNFRKPYPKMYGLPDGSLLIK